VLDNDEDKEQQAFIDYEKPTFDSAEQPNDCLHKADPKKVVKLIATDRAYFETQPAIRIWHVAKPAPWIATVQLHYLQDLT
jgi:predicted DCC family thiol-disulfide oxidoreductase YuxK